jgi:hypothetical protein
MEPQNAFFDVLTGKALELDPATKLRALVLGSVLCGFSLPALAAGTLFGCGGSLIVVARRSAGPPR